MTRPQIAERLESHLAQEPDAHEDTGSWSDGLLSLAMQLPGEFHELGATSAARMAARGDCLRNTAAAAMLAAYYTSPRDPDALLRTANDLVRAGDTMSALFAFAGVRALARTVGLHFHAEALAVAALAVLDRLDGFSPPLPAPAAGPADIGGEEHAALRDLWTTVVDHDSEATAAWISRHGAPHSGHPLLGPLYRLCETMLRTPHRYGPAGADLMRGRLLRGVAYSVPKLYNDRFHWYRHYADAALVDDEDVVVVYERWAQTLTMTGRLPEALAALDVPQEPATGVAAANALRGAARIWRVAGDFEASLDLNDRAMAAVAGVDATATKMGNLWLNRAYTLLGLERYADAFAAVRMAEDAYARDPFAVIGLAEARGLRCRCDPDPEAGAAMARHLLTLDDSQALPHPGRGSVLYQAGKSLMAEQPALALDAFERVAVAPSPWEQGGRQAILAGLAATRLAWTHRDDGRLEGVDGPALALRTHEAAVNQKNRLLAARSGLLLSRWLAASPETEGEVSRVTGAAVDDLGSALAGLAVDAGRRIVDDLQTAFDTAVRLGDGRLALRIAEIGRAVRLMALLRIRPQEMPDDIRRAVAALSAAERAGEGDLPESEAQPESGVRSAAAAAVTLHADAIEQQAGRIFRNLLAEPPLDVARAREMFPRAELLCLHEHLGTVRWVWWAPSEPTPRAGSITLAPRALRLLDAYANGRVSAVPGDSVAGLETVLPAALRERLLDHTGDGPPTDLLLVPGGRLWRVPFAALVLGERRRELCTVVRLTLSPSLSMATLVAEQALTVRQTGPANRAAGYCNDTLPGARDEKAALAHYEAFVAWQGLDAARDALSGPNDVEFGVLSTHGRPGPGLAQAVEDHALRRLTAGEALLLDFPRITALPVCFGMDAAPLDEPIGLVTVAQARGAVWVVGGYQQLRDHTTGWVLARTYRRMREGVHLVDALRTAQAEYLTALRQPGGADGDLARITAGLGENAAQQPSCWALTVVGPPHPDSWNNEGRGAKR
ncbi:CHAT domain-containing protein [Streptomyces sp. NPDC055254]